MPLKDFIPPIIARMGARLRPFRYGWRGDFQSWEEARKVTQGYNATEILRRVSAAAEKVKSGQAPYERDSVLFEEIQYAWPVLAAVLWSSARHEGVLRLLDFGGSLGSSFFQNRQFLADLKEVAWGVVEQEEFVQEGKLKFEDQSLKFYTDLETCVRELRPEIFLFSCVLQYLESPYDLLRKAMAHRPELIIIDNMPFTDGAQRLTVQIVPPQIYTASYPCWILNRSTFMNAFEPDYQLMASFKSPLSILLDGNTIPYEGFIYRRIATA